MLVRPSQRSRPRSRRRKAAGCAALALVSLAGSLGAEDSASANGAPRIDPAFMAMDFEALLEVKVTSVSKKEQKLTDVPSAVTVLTRDEILRSGATTVPQALRLVPGLSVAQVSSQVWAISARGFNLEFANKLLVMIDGRSVYTPLFSGVYWDVQQVLLEDLDRIEVIRGPGASVWGANAVNGVINIVTKSARETQGGLVTFGGGTEHEVSTGFRYGVKLNDETFARIYGLYDQFDDMVYATGRDGKDSWYQGRGGMRLDWEPDERSKFTLQGDLYGGRKNQRGTLISANPPSAVLNKEDTVLAGGNVVGRWTRIFSDEATFTAQAYYDRTDRDTFELREERDTFDVDLQQNITWGRHALAGGVGYRYTTDKNTAYHSSVSFHPASQGDHLYSAFLQDEIAVQPERLWLTLGSKFEHNDYTGFEVQPSARISFKPTEQQTVWAAVSRAVRTPSRADEGLTVNAGYVPPGSMGPGSPPAIVQVRGNNEGAVSEELIAYELGYRIQPTKNLSFDVALFYHDYENFVALAEQPRQFVPGANPYVLLPIRFRNALNGEAYGGEFSATWQILDNWRVSGWYAYTDIQLHREGQNISESVEGESPDHQIGVRSSFDLGRQWQFDVGVRYVDHLASLQVGSYVAADARIAWRPTQNFEFSVTGQNLLDDRHLEMVGKTAPRREVEHSVFGKVTYRF
jgi:iron complex outermembrane recepter protein